MTDINQIRSFKIRDDVYLKIQDAALCLDISLSTLDRKRRNGDGSLTYIKQDTGVTLYSLRSIKRYLAKRGKSIEPRILDCI